MKYKTLFIIAFLVATVATISSAKTDNVAEEVAWVVGDQPIYKSEIEETYRQMLQERQTIKGDPYCVIPEQLAINKLFLHQAVLDTVEVSDGAVLQQVESRINFFITNLGSKEKVEEYFSKSVPELREEMTEIIRDQYRIQEVQRNLTKNVKVTPSDVRRYFDRLPADSVPYVPLQVETQIITINPLVPQQEIEDVKARLRDYTERINNGESFSTLAILYSEDGSGLYGGEIGFKGRGQLVPEYASVAFNLNDTKKVSKIVETEYGFHIIQLIEKRGDRINTRHILLRPKVSTKDVTDAMSRLDSIRTDMLDKKFTFEEATSIISQDKDTRNSRGVMVNEETGTTRFEMSQLPQEVALNVNSLQEGEISKPFVMKDPKRNRDIVAIVKLTRRIPAHKANLSDDFQQIKTMCENAERNRIITEWTQTKINDTYIRIEDDWRNCQFSHSGWVK